MSGLLLTLRFPCVGSVIHNHGNCGSSLMVKRRRDQCARSSRTTLIRMSKFVEARGEFVTGDSALKR